MELRVSGGRSETFHRPGASAFCASSKENPAGWGTRRDFSVDASRGRLVEVHRAHESNKARQSCLPDIALPPGCLLLIASELDNVDAILLRAVDHDAVLAGHRSSAPFSWSRISWRCF
jgi:hypothetical protein